MDALDKLKVKTIKDYNKLVKRLSKGYKDDYTLILHLINFIDNYEWLDNKYLIQEYLLNYGM